MWTEHGNQNDTTVNDGWKERLDIENGYMFGMFLCGNFLLPLPVIILSSFHFNGPEVKLEADSNLVASTIIIYTETF